MTVEYLETSLHDADQYIQLMKNSFGKNFDKNWYNWYNIKSSNGPSRLYSYVDTETGELVSSVCFLPLRITCAGVVYRGSIYVNAMTHPSYQGKGFNLQLLNLALGDARKVGDAFSITFPATDRASMSGMIKTGWRPVADIRYAKLDRPLSRTRPKAHEIARLDERFDELLTNFYAGIDFGVFKDHKFLNWRTCDRPDQTYSIHAYFRGNVPAGFIVLKQFEEPGIVKTHIMELIALDREVILDLLGVAQYKAYASKANILNVWKLEDSFFSEIFKEFGFVDTEDKNTLLVYQHGDPALPQINGGHMHISLADNDVY